VVSAVGADSGVVAAEDPSSSSPPHPASTSAISGIATKDLRMERIDTIMEVDDQEAMDTR
jgi:hypothetical protein